MNDICARCQANPATHTVTCLVKGSYLDFFLCATCAVASQLILVADTISEVPEVAIKCECGMTLELFRKIQRVGCAKCYKVLPLEKLMEDFHKATQHVGKIPMTSIDPAELQKRIKLLEVAMQEAVVKEDYEQAARIRDKVKELQRKN